MFKFIIKELMNEYLFFSFEFDLIGWFNWSMLVIK